jgi:hypothetical protein
MDNIPEIAIDGISLASSEGAVSLLDESPSTPLVAPLLPTAPAPRPASILSQPLFDDTDPRFRPVPRGAERSRRPVAPTLVVPAMLSIRGSDAASMVAPSVVTETSTRFDDDEEVDLEETTGTVAPSVVDDSESDAHTLSSQRRAENSSSSDEEDSKKGGKRKVTKKGVLHWVTTTDTLVGLSLKYNVSVEAIRLTNKLWGSSIFERGYLLIPVENWQGGASSERSEEDGGFALLFWTGCIGY